MTSRRQTLSKIGSLKMPVRCPGSHPPIKDEDHTPPSPAASQKLALKETGQREKAKSSSTASVAADDIVPGFGRRGLCCYVSGYYRFRTWWTITRRRVRIKNSHCGNCGCTSQAVSDFHHADQNCLVHCHRHTTHFCHTDHDRFRNDDTLENASASFDPNRPETFLRSHGDLDANAVPNP